MRTKLDIVDMLESEEGFVRLVLNSGVVEYGEPLEIIFDEDDKGMDTIKTLVFKPYFGRNEHYYGVADIEAYEPCDEEDIPPYE